MGDLIPEVLNLLPITDLQRLDAAITIAELNEGDCAAIGLHLMQLGLASRDEQGVMAAVPSREGCSWLDLVV